MLTIQLCEKCQHFTRYIYFSLNWIVGRKGYFFISVMITGLFAELATRGDVTIYLWISDYLHARISEKQ